MEIEFKLYLEPVPHQSVRAIPKIGQNGKPYNMFHQPNKIIKYRKNVRNLVMEQLPKNFEPFEKDIPLIMEVVYYFKYRKTEKKSLIGEMIPKVTSGDVHDNLNKALCDSLQGIVFQQDQQIFDFHAKKYWYKGNGIYIKISTFNKG